MEKAMWFGQPKNQLNDERVFIKSVFIEVNNFCWVSFITLHIWTAPPLYILLFFSLLLNFKIIILLIFLIISTLSHKNREYMIDDINLLKNNHLLIQWKCGFLFQFEKVVLVWFSFSLFKSIFRSINHIE